LAKGQSGTSSVRNLCISCARSGGVKPLRVRAMYIKRRPS
jgi:hypothetical protein